MKEDPTAKRAAKPKLDQPQELKTLTAKQILVLCHDLIYFDMDADDITSYLMAIIWNVSSVENRAQREDLVSVLTRNLYVHTIMSDRNRDEFINSLAEKFYPDNNEPEIDFIQ